MATSSIDQKPAGYIIYEGPSELNGKPIVAVATNVHRKSRNPKTGNMVPLYILDASQTPLDAVRSGADASVCGDCPLRGNQGKGRTCYVCVHQAPTSIYKAWRRGRYSHAWGAETFAGRMMRLGAYGDPAAIPLHIVERMLAQAKGQTGYTHQWRNPAFKSWSCYLMASVESEADAWHAEQSGWRCFRIIGENELPACNHLFGVWCGNMTHQGLTCEKCGMCGGRSSKITRRADGKPLHIAIRVHGVRKGNLAIA